MPATSEARNAEPIPNAIVSSAFEAGRRMSGRTGMSFASTVSRVIDVPVTQSCLDPLIVPAWTAAISSSVACSDDPVGALDPGDARVDEQAPADERDDHRCRDDGTQRPGREARQGSLDPAAERERRCRSAR